MIHSPGWVLALAGLAAVGCQSESELQYRSTVVTETEGVALSEDGLTSYAAMAGTTCALDVRWGCAKSDEDLPTDHEAVLDHFEGVTLASSDVTLHFMHGGTWDRSLDREVPSLLTARLSRAGVLALVDDGACHLAIGDDVVSLDGAFCAAERYEVDRDGALLAATADGVFRADVSGLSRVADRGDRLAVDTAGRVFVATSGERTLRSLGESGWRIDLEPRIRHIAVRGDKGDVMVLGEDANGRGAILRIDGDSGAVLSMANVPSADADLITSANGRTLALVTGSEVHHYEIDVDGERPPVGEDVECSDIPVASGNAVGFD